ncbi:hypothetical protein LINPERHAP2_LOCUS16762 [Linum perenne]
MIRQSGASLCFRLGYISLCSEDPCLPSEINRPHPGSSIPL